MKWIIWILVVCMLSLAVFSINQTTTASVTIISNVSGNIITPLISETVTLINAQPKMIQMIGVSGEAYQIICHEFWDFSYWFSWTHFQCYALYYIISFLAVFGVSLWLFIKGKKKNKKHKQELTEFLGEIEGK